MTSPDLLDGPLEDPMDVMEWLRANSRMLTIGAVIVVAAAVGWYWVSSSRTTREINASKALFQARQSMMAGNSALAQADLKKLVDRYDGTSGGAEGAMLLAQLDFQQAKYAEGLAVLESATKSAPKPLAIEIVALSGDGMMAMKNPVGAAKAYEQAADMAASDLDRAAQRARAARAYTVAGDSAKSKAIWADLVSDTKNPAVAAEAKVRLGELSAKAAR